MHAYVSIASRSLNGLIRTIQCHDRCGSSYRVHKSRSVPSSGKGLGVEAGFGVVVVVPRAPGTLVPNLLGSFGA